MELSMLKDSTYLKSKSNIEFRVIREIGFSQKELAKRFHLYQDFKDDSSSTYIEIFDKNLFNTNEIYQVWMLDTNENKPIGLAIAIAFHNEEGYDMIDKKELHPGVIVGQLHFYVNQRYRKLGLCKEIVPEMEDFLYKKCPSKMTPCIIMEDLAYVLAKYTQKCCILSDSFDNNQQQLEYDNYISGNGRWMKKEMEKMKFNENMKRLK